MVHSIHRVNVRYNFSLPELFENRLIKYKVHVDTSTESHAYDMIMGRDLLTELGIVLDFSTQQIIWDGATVPMRSPHALYE